MSKEEFLESSALGYFPWVSVRSIAKHNLMFSCGILLFSRNAECIPLSECYTVWSQILALWAYLQKDLSSPHTGILHLPLQECLQHVKELMNLEDSGTRGYLSSRSLLGLSFRFQKAGTDTARH